MAGEEQFAGLLIHTCRVKRRQLDEDGEEVTDRFGQPLQEDEVSHEIPCRLSRASGSEQNTDRSRDVIVANYKIFLPAGADLREDDVVTVIGPDGSVKCEDAEVDFVDDVDDGDSVHHREGKLITQRQAR